MPTITLQVLNGAWDGHLNFDGNSVITNQHVILTNIGSDTKIFCYFSASQNSVDLSPLIGATINSAVMKVWGQGDNSNTCNCKIYCDKANTPVPPTDPATFAAKVRSTAFYDWSTMGGWNPGGDLADEYTTPDFKDALQEAVNNGSWDGSAIGVIWDGYSIGFFVQRYFKAFDNYQPENGQAPPTLIIDYTAGAGVAPGTPGTPTAAVLSPTQVQLTFAAGSPAGTPAPTYTATSSPAGFNASGPSPLTVTGAFVEDQAYTWTISSTNATGSAGPSGASNSVIPNPADEGGGGSGPDEAFLSPWVNTFFNH